MASIYYENMINYLMYMIEDMISNIVNVIEIVNMSVMNLSKKHWMALRRSLQIILL